MRERTEVVAVAAFALLAGGIGAPAHGQAQAYARRAGESDQALAQRVLNCNQDDTPHVVAANWNGAPTLFVDCQTTADGKTDRNVVALMRRPDGQYRLVHVTVGEEEGGVAELAAIGFADADRSGAKALITILGWDQNHDGLVSGTLYEVRIYAPPRAGQGHLTLLKISSHFGAGCECRHGDGPPRHPEYDTHYRFKTIAAVKRELKLMGYSSASPARPRRSLEGLRHAPDAAARGA